MKNRRHEIRPTIQQHHVTTNYNVGVVGRRWRQLPFKFDRNRLDSLLESRWKRAALYKLLFESGRQSVLLRQAWRKGVSVVVVPRTHGVSVVIAERRGRVIVVTVLVPVTVTMAVPVA